MSKNILKIEHDLDTKNTVISLRDEPIGLIQDFEFRASVDNPVPEIEFTFPILQEWHGEIFQKLNHYEELLLAARHLGGKIKIKFSKLDCCAGSVKQEQISKKEFSSSTPIEEIDLSKFDQPKLESSDIPA